MNVYDILIADKEKVELDDVQLAATSKQAIDLFIQEHRHIDLLTQYHLPVNNKILLHGHSGCGKTMTAKAIAHRLQKTLYILNLSTIVNARIGETSQNLKLLFDKAARDKAVLFLDEFDLLGRARDNEDRDVGELKRVVNTMIQLIDYLPNQAVLIAATNHVDMIDIALIRRFQLRLAYTMPTPAELDLYYDKLLKSFPADWHNIPRKYDISYAEAKDWLQTHLKQIIIAAAEQGALIPTSIIDNATI